MKSASSLDSAASVIRVARQLSHVQVPSPAGGETAERFSVLSEVAAVDLALSRIVEGHLDAVAILDEAGARPHDGLYGVWAADSNGVTVSKIGSSHRLNGRKRFCSGATGIDYALVTTSDGSMFDVELRQSGVVPVAGTWPAVGMAASDSLDVVFENAEVSAPIALPSFYLERPGFWHGAVGVAACWFGGALGAWRMLRARLQQKLTSHQAVHAGVILAECEIMRSAIERAAHEIDESGRKPDPSGKRRALLVRHIVERGCMTVVEHVGRAGGTTPLVYDSAHARRIPDLMVYLRQHHAEADLEELGRLAVV
ncbi:MAG: hypothetical protein QM831_22650 [Kofleriaceae bacterium]